MKRLLFPLIGVALAFSGVESVKAALIPLSSPADFSGGETLFTFEDLNVFDELSSLGGVNFALEGTTSLAQIAFIPDSTLPREFGPPEGNFVNKFQFEGEGLRITFPNQINRIATEIQPGPGSGEPPIEANITFDLFRSGSLLDSITFLSQGREQFFFYGLESTNAFDEVLITPEVITPIPSGGIVTDRRLSLDNLRFEQVSVPEPSSTLDFLAIGTLGVGSAFLYRRKK